VRCDEGQCTLIRLKEASSEFIASACANRWRSPHHFALRITVIMSGIEIAGLILPILVEVLKSYTIVRDKVRTIRRCTQVAEDLSADFAVIRITFLNDVRWILRSIENKEQAKNILEDVDDWRPMSRELNNQLNTVLQDSYDACFEIIKRNRLILEEMHDELKRFDVLLIEKTEVRFPPSRSV
jgi:hypothetical protein